MESFYELMHQGGARALVGQVFDMPVHVSYAKLTDSRFLSIGLKKAPDHFESTSEEAIIREAALLPGGRQDATIQLRLVRITASGNRLWAVVDLMAALFQLSAAKTAEMEAAEEAIQMVRRASYAAYDAAILAERQKAEDDVLAAEAARLKLARDAESDAMARDGSQWLPDNAYWGCVYPQGQSYGQQLLKLLKGQ